MLSEAFYGSSTILLPLLLCHLKNLLALMTILAQSLLTLVSSHLVALLFLSVWHNRLNIKNVNVCYFTSCVPQNSWQA